MPDYRRYRLPGGTYFLMINCWNGAPEISEIAFLEPVGRGRACEESPGLTPVPDTQDDDRVPLTA